MFCLSVKNWSNWKFKWSVRERRSWITCEEITKACMPMNVKKNHRSREAVQSLGRSKVAWGFGSSLGMEPLIWQSEREWSRMTEWISSFWVVDFGDDKVNL